MKNLTSGFLSYILRHHPEEVNVTLDNQGWADVNQLIQGIRDKGYYCDKSILSHIVATNDKQRFAFNSDQTKIRANQGHSVKIDLEYSTTQPPDKLYHGTSVEAFKIIAKEGIQKMSRHAVHLTEDVGRAVKTGKRKGISICLEIDSKAMHEDGFTFQHTPNGVWLTDNVPVRYILNIVS